jgi:hypothetical protein
MQPRQGRARQSTRQTIGSQFGKMQNFVGINIADSGNDMLIQQQRFQVASTLLE